MTTKRQRRGTQEKCEVRSHLAADHDREQKTAAWSTQSQRNLTLDGSENEESNDAVVEATGGLCNTGQDGERVQQVAAKEKPVSGSTDTASHRSIRNSRL